MLEIVLLSPSSSCKRQLSNQPCCELDPRQNRQETTGDSRDRRTETGEARFELGQGQSLRPPTMTTEVSHHHWRLLHPRVICMQCHPFVRCALQLTLLPSIDQSSLPKFPTSRTFVSGQVTIRQFRQRCCRCCMVCVAVLCVMLCVMLICRIPEGVTSVTGNLNTPAPHTPFHPESLI